MKILLADDDNGIRLYLSKYFEKRGFEVTACATGNEAWNKYLEGDFTLAVVDWNMPGITGPELCERIKTMGERSFIYIILLTSRSQSDEVVEGLNRGADDYLKKPVVAAELDARIKTALRIIDYEKKARAKEKQVRHACFKTLTDLAERRDHESAEHMERIGVYSELLAREMQLPEFFCRSLHEFAPMHDIGKVGIPDGILHVPRNLSVPEREVIMLHTTIGWQILKGKEEFDLAASIAYTHHEQWNGNGYPRHLSGELIPLEGRIVAVADCYDSLRTTRPYSPPYAHEEVMAYLQEQSGKMFDPEVIKAAVSVNEDMRRIFDATEQLLINVKP